MKKIKKLFIILFFFTVPSIAFTKPCICYDQFNTGWQAATTAYVNCLNNLLFAPVGSWGAFFSGNYRGAFLSSFGAVYGMQNCDNTYYSTWDQLGSQFDYCYSGCN